MTEPRDSLHLGIFIDDRLMRGDCACTQECRHIVSQFRMGIGRYRRMRRLFIASTPSEFLAFSPPIVESRRHAMAVLDLDAYPDFTAVMDAAKVTSEKKGRANREFARAQRAGYYVKPFAFRQFVPDIVAIHRSKDVRHKRPVQGVYYAKSVEELGGAPASPVEIEAVGCPQHNLQFWGVFQREEGYRQGEVETNERLVGYIRLRRQGVSMSYTTIMGHGDHLRHGIMYLLHYEIVAHFLRQSSSERPRYLVYLHYTLGEGDTMEVWKHRALFKPRYLHYVEDRPVSLPVKPPMPRLGEALLALKTTIFEPWPHAVEAAAAWGISPEWLKRIHRIWVVEQTHTPSLTARILREGPNPPLATLRPLASGLFPTELLKGISSVAVVLHGDGRGLDSLLPIHDAGIRAVTVYHIDVSELEALKDLYAEEWVFRPLTDSMPGVEDVEILIVECPGVGDVDFLQTRLKRLVGNFTGLLLIGLGEQSLAWMGYDIVGISALFGLYGPDQGAAAQLSDRMSRLLRGEVQFRGAYYRHADPEETFWIALKIQERC